MNVTRNFVDSTEKYNQIFIIESIKRSNYKIASFSMKTRNSVWFHQNALYHIRLVDTIRTFLSEHIIKIQIVKQKTKR